MVETHGARVRSSTTSSSIAASMSQKGRERRAQVVGDRSDGASAARESAASGRVSSCASCPMTASPRRRSLPSPRCGAGDHAPVSLSGADGDQRIADLTHLPNDPGGCPPARLATPQARPRPRWRRRSGRRASTRTSAAPRQERFRGPPRRPRPPRRRSGPSGRRGRCPASRWAPASPSAKTAPTRPAVTEAAWAPYTGPTMAPTSAPAATAIASEPFTAGPAGSGSQHPTRSRSTVGSRRRPRSSPALGGCGPSRLWCRCRRRSARRGPSAGRG